MPKRQRIKKVLAIILVLTFCSFPVSINAVEEQTAENALSPEEKISDSLVQEFTRLEKENVDLSQKKIPVWIWYKDIDQKQVDSAVKAQTGLTQDNIAVDFEMPAPALLGTLQNGQQGSQEQMQNYLARTKVVRELEAQRTDTYVMTRRAVSREKYNQKSAAVIGEIELNKQDISFNSQYAPVVMAKMMRKEIEQTALLNNIDALSSYEDYEIKQSNYGFHKSMCLPVDKRKVICYNNPVNKARQ